MTNVLVWTPSDLIVLITVMALILILCGGIIWYKVKLAYRRFQQRKKENARASHPA